MKTIYGFKMRSFILAAALGAGVGFVSSASAIDHSYIVDLNSKTAVDLGSLGGSTYAEAINDAGQIAGYFETRGGSPHAFITGPNGVGMTDLGTLDGDYSVANNINNGGQVVGYFETSGGSDHAFITGPNGVGMTDLGTLGGDYSVANSINNAGQVVGSYRASDGSQHAFITGPNGVGMTDLGFPDGSWSSAIGINDAGQVVGSFSIGSSAYAFITGPNGVGITDLGAFSFAEDINALGQVVGGIPFQSFITGPDGVGKTELGSLMGEGTLIADTFGVAINNSGQIVGQSGAGEFGNEHAFITGPNGVGMTDLNSLVSLPNGVVLTEAKGINNMGQVVATGPIPATSGPIPAVPEPASWALTLAGLGLMGFTAIRRRRAGGAEQWLALSDIELAKAGAC